MKVVIIVAILLGSMFLGAAAREHQYKKYHSISEIKRLLLEIKREIEFSAKPVGEIFGGMEVQKYKYIRPFLEQLRLEKNGESFKAQWSEGLQIFNGKYNAFAADEMALLQNFGLSFGNGDVFQQVKLIDMTVEYFEKSEATAQSNAQKQGKLKLLLPIYAGLVICILIM